MAYANILSLNFVYRECPYYYRDITPKIALSGSGLPGGEDLPRWDSFMSTKKQGLPPAFGFFSLFVTLLFYDLSVFSQEKAC